jgi:hypothetical protein
MLEFLVAQNWEGAESSGPRALRSSRSGIARGRCREAGMWRFLKPMIEPWTCAGRIICFLPAASGGCAVPGAWRIVQIAQALHKKAQFCTFGRDSSFSSGLGVSPSQCSKAHPATNLPFERCKLHTQHLHILESCTKSAQMPFLVTEIYQDQP